MKLEGVIFDFDGTLADTLPICIAAFQHVFAEFLGRHYTDEEIAAMFGPSEEGAIQRLIPDQWQAGLKTYLAAYERVHDQCVEPFPGIETALHLLKQRGVALALVTGKGPHSTAYSLKHLSLAHHFDVVETGSPDGPVKPLLIRKVLKKWGVPPHAVAYVGDVASDMEAAIQTGVIPIGAAWAATSSAESLNMMAPLATFRSVEDFIDWIETNCNKSTINRGV